MQRVVAVVVVVAVGGACSRRETPQRIDAGRVIVDAGPSVDTPPYVDPGAPVCAAPPAPPVLPAPSVHSGSRLIVRELAEPVSGGLSVLWSVHDSQLDVDCQATRYIDGKLRCVPLVPVAYQLSGKQWADAAKTVPVALFYFNGLPAVGTLVAYVTYAPNTCWSATVEVLARVGAQRQGTTYYNDAGTPITVPMGAALFDLISVPIDFVELQEQRAALSGSIAIRELHGTDGSSFPYQLYDTVHDVEVFPVDVSPQRFLYPPTLDRQPYHRHPPPSGSLSTYCQAQEDLFGVPVCDADTLHFAHVGSQLYKVTKQFGTVWRCYFGDAPPQALAVTGNFMGSCGLVPQSEWTQLSELTLGSARITTKVDAVGSTPFATPKPPRTLQDTSLGVPCTPIVAADGALHCVPFITAQVAYADAGCTMRIAESFSVAPAYAGESANGTTVIYAVGAPRPSGPVYFRSGTACNSSGSAYPSWELGGEVPPSTFAQLELRDVP